jgi:hypothetical protein
VLAVTLENMYLREVNWFEPRLDYRLILTFLAVFPSLSQANVKTVLANSTRMLRSKHFLTIHNNLSISFDAVS